MYANTWKPQLKKSADMFKMIMSINMFRPCSLFGSANYCVSPRSAPKATFNALNALPNALNNNSLRILIQAIVSLLINIQGVFCRKIVWLVDSNHYQTDQRYRKAIWEKSDQTQVL